MSTTEAGSLAGQGTSHRVSRLLMVVAIGAFVAAGWLLTKDVYSDTSARYEKGPTGFETTSPSRCGAAYDVIWLEGDGFMGGEPPVNQSVLNKECVQKAGTRVSVAMLLTGGGVVLLGGAGWSARRRLSSER
jgi:hypothetical protein